MTLFELFLLGSTLILAGTTIWAFGKNRQVCDAYWQLAESHERLVNALNRSFEEKDGG